FAAAAIGDERPTVTDADVVLGKIDPDGFAGGAIALDRDAAVRAIEKMVAAPLGENADRAANAVAEIVEENMAAAARAHAVETGESVAARTMIAFGGAAPLHAARLAEKLNIDEIIVPANAGVGSAVGFLLAPAAYEVVRSRPMALKTLDADTVNALYAEMREEAGAVVRAAVGDAALVATATAYARYRGQGHELATPLTDFDPRSMASSLQAAFEDAYARLYGRVLPSAEIEILTWSLALRAAKPAAAPVAETPAASAVASDATRDVYDAGAGDRIAYALVDRDALFPGAIVNGPALIVEAQTTCVVTPAYSAQVDGAANLILTRRNG
ncbi:MAG: hydantoinase/oxoprolinase family protein, partial [Pseudomonadota bacterium]